MKVIIALPLCDFDPTESAVPHQVLTAAGHDVAFATPTGAVGRADERMLTGRGLGPFRPVLIASEQARRAYHEMANTRAFQRPIPYAGIAAHHADAIVLPGGHAQGMRPFLESRELQAAVCEHVRRDLPIGAICHGVLVMARTVDPSTGHSVLHGRRTTALLETLELSAWWMTCAWLGNYYRTYPETVEHEVRRALARPEHFVAGPLAVRRDSAEDPSPGFAVTDGAYVSARWPGDAYTFSHQLAAML